MTPRHGSSGRDFFAVKERKKIYENRSAQETTSQNSFHRSMWIGEKKETFLLNCTFWLQEGFFLSELFPVQTLAVSIRAGFPYTNILAVCAVDRFLIDWPNTHAKRDCCSFLQKILKIGFFYTHTMFA